MKNAFLHFNKVFVRSEQDFNICGLLKADYTKKIGNRIKINICGSKLEYWLITY